MNSVFPRGDSMKKRNDIVLVQARRRRRMTVVCGIPHLMSRVGKNFSNGAAFTLTEVMVAVIVLSILATMAVRSLLWMVEGSRGAEAQDILTKCYAGYQRVLADEEGISGLMPLTWSRLGMTNPNLNPERYFDYSILDSDAAPRLMYADRLGQPGCWLYISLTSGCITKTSPY